MRESWGKAIHTLQYEIKIEEAPDIRVRGEKLSPYLIDVRFKWEEGEAVETMYNVHVYRRRSNGELDKFRPGQLIDTDPGMKDIDWLQSIVNRAESRRQDVHL
jgi:hypothetical protein